MIRNIGRIEYGPGVAVPTELAVTYNYGAPALMAGGYYDRTANITQPGTQPGVEFVGIGTATFSKAIVGSAQYPSLLSAVLAWNELPANSAGTIVLSNFDTHAIDLTGANAIQIPAESQLLIIAVTHSPASGAPPEWKNSCVTLCGNIEVHAPTIPIDSDGVSLPMGSLLFSGLWISGQLILSGDEACAAACRQYAGSRHFAHHSRRPRASRGGKHYRLGHRGYAAAQPRHQRTHHTAPNLHRSHLRKHCRCGFAVLPGAIAGLDLSSPGPTLHIEDSTMIGRVWAQAIQLASNTIFWAKMGCLDPWAAPVIANRRHTGCVRFSWLPATAITPQQYLCLTSPTTSGQVIEPTFITLRFGHPGYCLLSGDVPMAIWKGADNGSQMGVYYQMQETEAVTNIQIRSAKYLPANLQSGVVLIPSRSIVEAVPTMEYGGQQIQLPPRCGCTEAEDLPTGIGIGLI